MLRELVPVFSDRAPRPGALFAATFEEALARLAVQPAAPGGRPPDGMLASLPWTEPAAALQALRATIREDPWIIVQGLEGATEADGALLDALARQASMHEFAFVGAPPEVAAALTERCRAEGVPIL